MQETRPRGPEIASRIIEEEHMEMKRKPLHLRHKAEFEKELKDRLAYLSGKGIEAHAVDKDPIVKKLKADIKAVDRRLKVVAEHEKRTEEMAKAKADKAAARLKEKEAGEAEKAQKPKKAPAPAKEKKAKPEKKPAPPKAPEGGQGQAS